MTKNTAQLVEELKENGEDIEWYPTTQEIINKVAVSIREDSTILDIGAGRGDVLRGISETAKRIDKRIGALFAIEQSPILCKQLPNDVAIIGTDFHRQTLIDKKVDVIFCNPPFRQFEEWAARIIREANCKRLFLVMPLRWYDSGEIGEALEARKVDTNILGEYTFDQGDRPARAVVNLVQIDIGKHDYNRNENNMQVDPFTLWFEETFAEQIADSKKWDPTEEIDLKAETEHAIAKGRNVIPVLEECYNREMSQLIKLYGHIAGLNEALLDTIGISKANICNSLKLKINNLKVNYWKELFDNLDSITDRLTTKSREKLLNRINEYTTVDFNAENAYAIVVWAIKNANLYLDKQLVDVFLEIATLDGCTPYKSNRHWHKDSWRFNQQTNNQAKRHGYSEGWYEKDQDFGGFKMDYRFVKSFWKLLHQEGDYESYNFEQYGGLHNIAGALLDDLITVACNLGYKRVNWIRSYKYTRGTEQPILATNTEGDVVELMRIRPYMNGNCHIKLNQDFLLRWNVEASRILGWVRTAEEAAEEMGEDLSEVKAVFNSHFRLEFGGVKLLEGSYE